MKYSIEPKFGKYVKGYGFLLKDMVFCLLQENLEINMVKN